MKIDYDSLPEVDQLALVSQDGYAIQYIQNPSEAVCMAAVEQDGVAISHIKNPSESVILAAVKQVGWAISYIQNPSEAVQMAAVEQNGLAIRDIKNPSEAVQIAAVKFDPGAICLVPGRVPDAVIATLLLYHPFSHYTSKEILDRAPDILEAHCTGLGDVYTIGFSMAMTGEALSKMMVEWIENSSEVTFSSP